MPMMAHLEEFRSRLIKAALAIAVGTAVAFFYNEQILALLAEPYHIAEPDGTLAFFRPTEAFSTVMRLSIFGGVILASPVILYQMWRFAAPALSPKEKKWAYPITTVFVILFTLGSGPVRGFAVTLGIGILTSVFTAIFVTRLLIVLWFERRRPKQIEV